MLDFQIGVTDRAGCCGNVCTSLIDFAGSRRGIIDLVRRSHLARFCGRWNRQQSWEMPGAPTQAECRLISLVPDEEQGGRSVTWRAVAWSDARQGLGAQPIL